MGCLLKTFAGGAVVLASGLLTLDAMADSFYRWVDEDGVVHYGDSVPPEYSKQERQIVNDYGVEIDRLAREKTAAELSAEQEALALEQEKQRQAEAEMRRDEVLLNTYLSVDEIEALRNQRMVLLDGRVRVTEAYLGSLRQKLANLQNDAKRFRPYSSDPDAPPIHDNLAKELSNTLNSIIAYEQTLTETRTQQVQLVAKFDDDITRFKSLKGLE
jgi:hypothetical protein